MKILCVFKNEFKNMFSTSRINRLRYISYTALIDIIMSIFLVFISSSIPLKPETYEMTIVFSIGIPILLFICLKIFLLGRRLNDVGISSKWTWKIFSTSYLFYLTALIIRKLFHVDFVMIFAIPFAITIFILEATHVIMFFKRGTTIENKYGEISAGNNFASVILAILFISLLLVTTLFFSLINLNHNDANDYSVYSKVTRH